MSCRTSFTLMSFVCFSRPDGLCDGHYSSGRRSFRWPACHWHSHVYCNGRYANCRIQSGSDQVCCSRTKQEKEKERERERERERESRRRSGEQTRKKVRTRAPSSEKACRAHCVLLESCKVEQSLQDQKSYSSRYSIVSVFSSNTCLEMCGLYRFAAICTTHSTKDSEALLA